MSTRPLIVIGGSAGGIEALATVLSALPEDLPAAVAVVIHLHRHAPAALAPVLDRRSALPVAFAADGEKLAPGRVLVAPTDRHLLVRPDRTVAVGHGPRENGHRPSVDVLFRSAAVHLGPQVIGVVLSGVLDDGSAGLHAVRQRGGAAVVQDPIDALYDGMPSNALKLVPDAMGVPARAIAARLCELVAHHTGLTAPGPAPAAMAVEAAMADPMSGPLDDSDNPGRPSTFSCPDCNGVLFELDDAQPRYRCRTGHAWAVDSLVEQQGHAIEGALWAAVRVLEERAQLCRDLGSRARQDRRPESAGHFERRAVDAAHQGTTIRQLIAQLGQDAADAP
jgi:two-component system chemotaxis response regulator CheB